MSYMDGSRKTESTYVGEFLFLKPSDLVKLIHYHENSMGKTCSHDSITSHWVSLITPGDYRLTFQYEIWVRAWPNHIMCP